jgi:hypothetical protein
MIGTSASPRRSARCAGETRNDPNRKRDEDTGRRSYTGASGASRASLTGRQRHGNIGIV